jgi:hypothetical protein
MRRSLTAHETGWLAGIVDGEGCLYLKLESNRKRYPVLQVEMTDYRTLVRVNDLLKPFGTPRWTNIPARAHRRHPAYRVVLRRPECILRFLDAIGPYLVTKAPHVHTMRLAAEKNIRLREKRIAKQRAYKEAA